MACQTRKKQALCVCFARGGSPTSSCVEITLLVFRQEFFVFFLILKMFKLSKKTLSSSGFHLSKTPQKTLHPLHLTSGSAEVVENQKNHKSKNKIKLLLTAFLSGKINFFAKQTQNVLE